MTLTRPSGKPKGSHLTIYERRARIEKQNAAERKRLKHQMLSYHCPAADCGAQLARIEFVMRETTTVYPRNNELYGIDLAVTGNQPFAIQTCRKGHAWEQPL